MRTVWGRRDQATTIPCTLDPGEDQNFTIEWRKDNKLIFSAYGNQPGHSAPFLQGRVTRDAGFGLTIHSVTNEDSGVYQCVITRFSKQTTRPEHGASIRFVVNVAPSIINPSTGSVEFRKVGDVLSLDCKAQGSPPPEVTWSKNDRIVSSTSVLHIPKLEDSDKGKYTCLAANIEGRASVSIELKFSKSTSFDFTPTNKTVIEGSNVFWHCHASSQPEKIQYRWLFNERDLKKTHVGLRADLQEGDLSLRDVRKTDRGWYRCEATNDNGQFSQSSAYLDVIYPPEPTPNQRQIYTMGVGKNGTLECDVDANPEPTQYSWTKNGHFIGTFTNNVLLLLEAKETDGGIYACQAENTVGKGPLMETHLVVAEPPMFTVTPPPEMHIREGSQMEVSCEGFGDPLPIVYWVFNQTRISSSVLSFSSVSHSDHGLYDCVVTNAVATITKTMNLIVEGTKPQAATIGPIECDGESSMSVEWTPGYDGTFAQTFVLHYTSLPDYIGFSVTTAQNSTRIDDLRPFTEYEFVVESRNRKGSVNSTSTRKYVCSTLASPSNVVLDDENELQWEPVSGAKSYMIESRKERNMGFHTVGEVGHPHFRLGPDPSVPVEIRIRSLHPPFEPSKPSRSITFGNSSSYEPSMMWAVLGGFMFFILFSAFYLYTRYRQSAQKTRKKSRQKSYSDFARPSSSQPQTETFYEPSLKLMDDRECGEWGGSRDNTVIMKYPPGLVPYEYDVGDEDTCSVIDDMLREKYIFGSDDEPTQLMNELRIERLRREYQQSQL